MSHDTTISWDLLALRDNDMIFTDLLVATNVQVLRFMGKNIKVQCKNSFSVDKSGNISRYELGFQIEFEERQNQSSQSPNIFVFS